MFQVLVSPSESTNVSYARENALISHDILSTSSLRKFVKIRWIFFTLQTARSDRNDSPITRHKKESPKLLLSCLIHWHLNKEFYCYLTATVTSLWIFRDRRMCQLPVIN